MERIIGIIESNRNGFENNKEKFKSFSNDVIQNIQSIQNIILTILGIVITVLIGLIAIPNQSDSANEDIFQQIIYTTKEQSLTFIIIIVSLGILYVVLIGFKMYISKKIWNIEKEYHKALITQNFMKGFIENKTLELDKVNETYLCNLRNCFIAVEGGLTQSIIDQYKKIKPRDFLLYHSEWCKEYELIEPIYKYFINISNYKKYDEIVSKIKSNAVNKDISNDVIKKEEKYFEELKKLFVKSVKDK